MRALGVIAFGVLLLTGLLGCGNKPDDKGSKYGLRHPSRWRMEREETRRSLAKSGGRSAKASKSRLERIVRDEIPAPRREEKKKPDPQKRKATDDPLAGLFDDVDDRVKAKGSGPPNPNASASSAGKGAGMLGVLSEMTTKLGSMFSRDSAEVASADGEDFCWGGRGAGGRGSGAGAGAGFGGWGGFGGGKGGEAGGGGGIGLGGSGFGLGKYKSRKPKVFMARANVTGGLDAATIRRVIRRHLSEIQYCYVTVGLTSNPNLSGMVKMSFTISPTGLVGSVQTASSTLGSPRTESCIKSAVRRWRFPKPEGSMPFVTYPFHFKPSGG